MNESSVQSKLVTSLRDTGSKVQKFSDQFGLGIPDLLVGTSDKGLWVELKYRELWPVKPGTSLLRVDSKNGISGNQVAWLREWYLRPLPTSVLLAFGDGSWLLVPQPVLFDLTDGPSSSFSTLLKTRPLSRVSIHTLFDAYDESLQLFSNS